MRKVLVPSVLCFLWVSGLAAQSIIITSPTRGDSWCRGREYTVTWTSTGNVGATVSIRVQLAGTRTWVSVADTANDGSHPWTVPASLAPGRYTLEIRNPARTAVALSPLFGIVDCGGTPPPPPPAAGIIEVVSPASNAVLVAGGSLAVAWKSQGIEKELLNIHLYTKDKILEKTIASAIPNSGGFSWPIPDKMEGDYFLLVQTVNGATSGHSGRFSIRRPGAPVVLSPVIVPFANRGPLGLRVTNPTACDVLKTGTWYSISWRAACPSTARLRVLLIQGSRLVMPIAENIPACDQQFGWMVGREAGGASRRLVGVDYRIVLQTPDGVNMGVSAQPFPIVDWTLAVQAPNGGEIWPYGTPQVISWRTSGTAMVANPAYPNLSHVRIDLFRPAGVFVGTIAYSTPDTGSYRWTTGVALDHSDQRVRLTDGPYVVLIYFGCGGGNIMDRSNAPFTIGNCPR